MITQQQFELPSLTTRSRSCRHTDPPAVSGQSAATSPGRRRYRARLPPPRYARVWPLHSIGGREHFDAAVEPTSAICWSSAGEIERARPPTSFSRLSPNKAAAWSRPRSGLPPPPTARTGHAGQGSGQRRPGTGTNCDDVAAGGSSDPSTPSSAAGIHHRRRAAPRDSCAAN